MTRDSRRHYRERDETSRVCEVALVSVCVTLALALIVVAGVLATGCGPAGETQIGDAQHGGLGIVFPPRAVGIERRWLAETAVTEWDYLRRRWGEPRPVVLYWCDVPSDVQALYRRWQDELGTAAQWDRWQQYAWAPGRAACVYDWPGVSDPYGICMVALYRATGKPVKTLQQINDLQWQGNRIEVGLAARR